MGINKYDNTAKAGDVTIVTWNDKYATGLDLVDDQHRQLVILANELYRACRLGDKEIHKVFSGAMHRMVEYVRFHFTAEQEMLQCIKYPDYLKHKNEHDSLIKDILEAAKEYDEGRKFVPNQFVRTLKDWVFGHIAVTDRIYSMYVSEQMKKGLLTLKDIETCQVVREGNFNPLLNR